VRVALATLKSVLDTVRVTASRLAGKDLAGFEERRRSSGAGKFLTAAQIAARAPLTLSDIFRNISGVSLDMAKGAEGGKIFMRSAFGACVPAFYLDGHFMGGGATPGFASSELTTSEVDAWVSNPDRIAAIEVYHDNVPPQFQQALTGCGSIVIWTK
jgi:hypothetical protein